jgi:hypothetical protein
MAPIPVAVDADPISALLVNGGIIGVFFVLALMGWIWLKPSVDRLVAQEARQQALIDTLLAVYHHEVLPTLGDYERRLAPLLTRVEKLVMEMEWRLNIEEDSDGAPARHTRGRGSQDSAGGGSRQSRGTRDNPKAAP